MRCARILFLYINIIYFHRKLNDAHRKNHNDKLTHQLRMLKDGLVNEIKRYFYFENLSERSLNETGSV